MKRLLLLFIFMCAFLFSSSCTYQNNFVKYQIYKIKQDEYEVYDGDTLNFTREGTKYRVRLLGIDTPEIKQYDYDQGASYWEMYYAQLAKEKLLEFLNDGEIYLKFYGYDKYNRLVGEIYNYQKESANEHLLKTGLARHHYMDISFKYSPYYVNSDILITKYQTFKSIENDAKANKIGFWGSKFLKEIFHK